MDRYRMDTEKREETNDQSALVWSFNEQKDHRPSSFLFTKKRVENQQQQQVC